MSYKRIMLIFLIRFLIDLAFTYYPYLERLINLLINLDFTFFLFLLNLINFLFLVILINR